MFVCLQVATAFLWLWSERTEQGALGETNEPVSRQTKFSIVCTAGLVKQNCTQLHDQIMYWCSVCSSCCHSRLSVASLIASLYNTSISC
ncbi:hypothetical protein PAHAL_3G164900 [Panicum hallii]|uniref:Secreted protein n=1 Tax=Panicum hallii TaxID=206008 RepID=A0A2T8KIK5_9POAL|nr:hypothetical protein PAHAL_3G164900 [Panicum hallii]